MLNPHDRRDLACLGLMVLVYGLAVAPVVHAVVGHGGGSRVAAARHGHGAHGHEHEHEHEHTALHGGAGGHEHTALHGGAGGHERGGASRQSPASRHEASGKASSLAARPEGKEHSQGRHAPDDGEQGDGHGPDGHQHLTGSVEHLHAMAASWVVMKLPRVRGVTWQAEVPRRVSVVAVSAPRPTAMPQGP